MTNGLFSNSLPIPIDAQIVCVQREIEMRRLVYARRVLEKRMTQKTSDHEIAAMEAVLATLKTIKEKTNA